MDMVLRGSMWRCSIMKENAELHEKQDFSKPDNEHAAELEGNFIESGGSVQ